MCFGSHPPGIDILDQALSVSPRSPTEELTRSANRHATGDRCAARMSLCSLKCSPTDLRPWHDEMYDATITWRENFQEETGGRRFFDVYDVLDTYDLEQVGSELVGPEWRITRDFDDSPSYRLFDDDAIALLAPAPILYVP